MTHYLHKILLATVAALGISTLNSCTDDLEITPDGRLDMETIFQDPDLIASYLASAWEEVPIHMYGYHFFSNLLMDISDEAWDCDDTQSGLLVTKIFAGDVSATDHPLNDWDYRGQGKWDGAFWTRYWRMNRILNQFIIRMESIKDSGILTDEVYSRYMGEAYTLRAYYYNMLLKFYGDLPIVTTVNDVNTSYAGMERTPAWQGFQHVVADCRRALDCEGLPWRITLADERNRMTKAIACAIMSQASIYAASPLFCHDEDLWEWAYQVNKEAFDLLTTNGYELYNMLQNPVTSKSREAGFLNPYHEYFAMHSVPGKHPEDKETIWGSSQGQLKADINQIPLFADGHFKCGVIPTQELVDAYDMLATGEPIYDLANPYVDEKHSDININAKSGYNPADPYTGRDPRFYANTFYNLAKVNTGILAKTVETFNNKEDWHGTPTGGKGGNCWIDRTSRMNTRSGYYNRKYLGDKAAKGSNVEEGNWKRFRLGEVYLNYAEAAIEAGHLPEGLKLINDIRHRAGFDPSVDKQTSDKAVARLYVHHERHVELAFEEHRYFDVRRWGRAGEDIKEEKYVTGMWITGTGSKPSNFTYTRFQLGAGQGATPSKPTYTAKNRLLPIQLSESANLGSQTGFGSDYWQNPGW